MARSDDTIERLAAEVRRLLQLHIEGWHPDLEDRFPHDGEAADYAVPGLRYRRPAVHEDYRIEGDDDLAAYDKQEYADDDGPESTPSGSPPPDPETTYVFLNRCPLFTARVYSTPDPNGAILVEFFAISRFPPGTFTRPTRRGCRHRRQAGAPAIVGSRPATVPARMP